MMKRIVSSVLITLGILLNTNIAAAANTPVKSPAVKCDINIVKVMVMKKPASIGTIMYNKEVYVSLEDLKNYCAYNMQTIAKSKEVNITPVTSKNAAMKSSVKLLAKKDASINADVNKYTIEYNGINEYIDNISYNKTVYANIRYLVEMLNSKVNYNKDGSITISSIPEVAAGTVNNEKITESELAFFYNASQSNQQAASEQELKDAKKKLRLDAFEKCAEMKVIIQKAKKDKIVLSTADKAKINSEYVQGVVNQYNGIAGFRKELENYKLSFHQYVLYSMDSFLCTKTINQYTGKILGNEDKLKIYYIDNITQFSQPEQVKAKHILIKTIDDSGKSFTDDKKAEAKKKAEDILTSLKKGEDFDTLMKKYSEDPGQGPDGYTFGKGQMVKEFEDAAFSLKPSELSGIVETSYGYHIIKLVEKIPQKPMPYDQVKGQIKNTLQGEETNKLLEKWKSESRIMYIIN